LPRISGESPLFFSAHTGGSSPVRQTEKLPETREGTIDFSQPPRLAGFCPPPRLRDNGQKKEATKFSATCIILGFGRGQL
jgi:hypothetical protein